MKSLKLYALLLLAFILQGCGFGDPDPEEQGINAFGNSASQGFNLAASRASFARTAQPLLIANCAQCHSGAGQSYPYHGDSSSDIAHAQILESRVVDFTNVANSRLVTRVRNDNHNCWTDNCQADADAIQAVLELWVSEIDFSTQVEETVAFDRDASIAAFRTTVHPLAEQHCGDCHRPNGRIKEQVPFHAHTDYSVAHNVTIDTARVNFTNIPRSRLVVRLREDAHYCWGDCEQNALEMEAAIEAWADQVDTAGLVNLNGARTASKGILDAEIRLPEPIKGSIVMQAESGILSGRYRIKADAGASDFKYVGTDNPPIHPNDGTNPVAVRIPSAHLRTTDCRPPSATALQNSSRAPFRIQERIRHPDPAGHLYYSQRLNAYIIRPQYREAFRVALLAGESEQALSRFFMTAEGPRTVDDDETDPPEVPLTLNDDPFEEAIVRVLPQFRDLAFFDGDLHTNGEANRNFFAPVHGPSGSEYWTADDATVRRDLPNSLKSGEVYQTVEVAFREYFFNRDDDEVSGWAPKTDIESVPFTLRTLASDPSVRFKDDILSSDPGRAQLFYDEFLAGLTPSNALEDVGGGVRRIDTYVYYLMSDENRDHDNFSQQHYDSVLDEMRTERFTLERDDGDLSNGRQYLNLTNLYTGGDQPSQRTLFIDHYNTIMKPIFTTHCVGCHGDGSNRPQFASNDPTLAYDAAAAITNFFNTADTRQARPVQRMLDDRHQCGDTANCDQIGADLMQALLDWNQANITATNAAALSSDSGYIALSESDRTPGRASFELNINQPGTYTAWVKMRASDNNTNSFYMTLLDSEGNTVIGAPNGNTDPPPCRPFDQDTSGNWIWHTADYRNPERGNTWDLPVGTYTLELIEREVGADLDMIALSSNPEFNPAKNLIDEGSIQTRAPKILTYDLTAQLGQPGQFEIEVQQRPSGDAYLFRNPRFRNIEGNLRYSNLRILVNNEFEFTNATYTQLNRVVDGRDSGILSQASLVALIEGDPETDQFSFIFEDLTIVNQAAEPFDDDAPVPVEGRVCLDVDLFERTVMPVLNNFKLIDKADYREHTASDFPGTEGDERDGNPTLYNCTTCHNEEHQYFKMTTFADGLEPGEPVPQEGLEALCAQALSRVDFNNFDRSLLLRGLNGTFDHPKLHFVQSVNLVGSGNSRAFQTSSSDPSGYQSTFIGHRYEVWRENELQLDNYQGAQRDYLEGFVGRYKSFRYQRLNDPFSPLNGTLLTEGYQVETDLNGITTNVIEQPGATNLITAFDPVATVASIPEGELADTLSEDPINNNDVFWTIREACQGQPFNQEGGVISDPCNNNANYETEFELIKQTYRASIIDWMEEEKRLFDLNNR